MNVKIMCLASHHTTRCGCIWQTAHLEARFNTAARPPQSTPQTGTLEGIKEWSGQQRAGGGSEREGQPVPCPPTEANLHISCNLRGIIWIRMIGTAQQIHELSISFKSNEVLLLIFKFNLAGSLCFLLAGK